MQPWFCLTVSIIAAAAHAQSVDFQNNGAHISVAVVADGVFRLSANVKKPATALPSIFLDPQLKTVDVGHVGYTGAGITVSTPRGTLKIDSMAGAYELLDAAGKTLAPACPILRQPELGKIAINIGWPADQKFEVYGCGNGTDSLRQTKILSHVGNGVAVEPFFFAPQGFAVLAVSENGNDPAICDGAIHDGAVAWSAPGTAEDLYLIIAPTLGDATRQLLSLTGAPPVPPRWTMGYLQSRWGWKDKAYIDDTLSQFEKLKLPVDAFIFDFEWYTTFPDYEVKPEGVEGFSDFNFNPALFPDPAAQIQTLHEHGVKFVGIRKPRLGNSETLSMVRDKGWGFHSDLGEQIDKRGLWFADPALRDWYAAQNVPLLKTGIDGWWDDEGEFTFTNYIYWNMAQRQALDAVDPKARLWTIDRAFQPGLARTGATAWTGDISATWKSLKQTPTALMNWSVGGMPWCGCDLGGFAEETTPALLTRFMEAGTFFPIMRAHSVNSAKPHFPWLFGPDAEAAIRKALNLRYQLVPMIYSLAHQQTGTLIMRPLVVDFPDDPKVANLSDEWLFGPSLLAAPVLTEKSTRTIYLPAGEWFDFATGDKFDGGREFDQTVPMDSAPLFVRAGSILPLGPVIQHTAELPGGPLELRVYPGRDATFTLVEDDGMTTAYHAGQIRSTEFKWNDAMRELSWRRSGPYAGRDCFTSMTIEAIDSHQQWRQNDFAADGKVILK